MEKYQIILQSSTIGPNYHDISYIIQSIIFSLHIMNSWNEIWYAIGNIIRAIICWILQLNAIIK